MRLICPNCDAEYEVDDAAIPREGRYVQCSNCGNAWFQLHPEVEVDREAEADLYDAPPGAMAPEGAGSLSASRPVSKPLGPVAADLPRTSDEYDDEAPDADLPPEPGAAPGKMRALDETVLAVLKEEAERETSARRAEAAPRPMLENQIEMPLAPAKDVGGMTAAVQRIARMRAVAAEVAPQNDPAAGREQVPAQRSRGQMFPAIEEINSTLRATGERGKNEDDAIIDTLPDLTRTRKGKRRGFLTVVVLAMVIVALYLLAPIIGANVPALDGLARAYVLAIDAARLWLDVNLRALVAALRGLAGSQGG